MVRPGICGVPDCRARAQNGVLSSVARLASGHPLEAPPRSKNTAHLKADCFDRRIVFTIRSLCVLGDGMTKVAVFATVGRAFSDSILLIRAMPILAFAYAVLHTAFPLIREHYKISDVALTPEAMLL